jgi:hypothetical protein
MGLGMMSVLTLGVINRVMIDAGVEKKYRSIWGGCCLTRRCCNTGWCSPGKPVEWLWQFGCGGELTLRNSAIMLRRQFSLRSKMIWINF